MRKIAYMIFGLFLLAGHAFSQKPTHLAPIGDEPVEFNAVKILLYIVFPLAMMVTYFLLRRRQKKRREDELRQRKGS